MTKTNEDFIKVYGCSKKTIQILFKKALFVDKSIQKQHIKEFLKYLVTNQSFKTQATTSGYTSCTVKNHIWNVAKVLYPIAITSNQKIFQDRLEKNKIITPIGGYACMAIDGTACPIPPVPLNSEDKRKFYSKKTNSHCVKYLIGVGLRNGLGYISDGPIQGEVQNLVMLKDSKILNKLLPNEKILCDKGFIDTSLEGVVLTPFNCDQLESKDRLYNYYISSNRCLLENFISRLKRFKVLSTAFRANLNNHQMIFTICLWLTNLDILDRPLQIDWFKSKENLYDEDDSSEEEYSDSDHTFHHKHSGILAKKQKTTGKMSATNTPILVDTPTHPIPIQPTPNLLLTNPTINTKNHFIPLTNQIHKPQPYTQTNVPITVPHDNIKRKSSELGLEYFIIDDYHSPTPKITVKFPRIKSMVTNEEIICHLNHNFDIHNCILNIKARILYSNTLNNFSKEMFYHINLSPKYIFSQFVNKHEHDDVIEYIIFIERKISELQQ
ncbi:hypothetical protein DLAC_09833 [Tieghemostelium lacteum]|uniref:DDE Tnp4 domain-containing protein n=1 Tax=Tieghemostelium lacteum TaxID=361077 RepID=A0A151Z7E7_TIELA|nr:hypothetical protein DLAC_09833 [Tieghemostelium lacteum]|eukprot:KYQ89857.1 hypothetical protein DLAC_09833 [Tieghemostelium lacteum]